MLDIGGLQFLFISSLSQTGGVYAIDVPTPSRRDPPLLQLRQFQGKGYSKLNAGFASDSVYAVRMLQNLKNGVVENAMEEIVGECA